MRRLKTQQILKKLISVLLVLALSISALGSVITYVYADTTNAYGTLGTNVALGSPILNNNFSEEDWNKWEMIVWGIFLSNFSTPFIDDYNSAFNLDSGYGSNGSGAKALQFASGSDIQNSKVLQDLLDYAVNQQTNGSPKPIYVSYNKLENGEITSKSEFSGGSSGSTSAPAAGTGQLVPTIRAATVKDLFIDSKDSGDDDKTWAHLDDANGWTVEKFINTKNYIPLVGIDNGRIPTFAIKTGAGTYERIFDYTDSYDLGITSLVITRGLCGDYKEEFGKMMDSVAANPESYPLVLDCFGNICTEIDGTHRVIVPAAANKWLTNNPSINMVNSLVFNSCTNTTPAEQLILNAGQTRNSWWLSWDAGIRSGVAAFANKTDGVKTGQAVIYFDTDTIVMQDAIKAGQRSDYTVNTGELYEKLYSLDINSLMTGNYTFKMEPANLSNDTFGIFQSDAEKMCKNMILASSQLSNMVNTVPDTKVLTQLKTDTGTLNIFGDPVIIPVQVVEGKKVHGGFPITGWGASKANYNAGAIHRMFGNYAYQAYKSDMQTVMGTVSSAEVRKAYEDSTTPNELLTNLVTKNSGSELTDLAAAFIASRPEFYTVGDNSKLKTISISGAATGGNPGLAIEGIGISDSKTLKVEANKVDSSFGSLFGRSNVTGATYESEFTRSVKAYSTSEVMRSIANILGVRDGTEFSVYSMYIYLTYLDWYGITNSLNSLSSDGNKSNLNTRIFDENSDVLKAQIGDITTVTTDEQKEKQILNWTYLMLNPTEGREYRSQIIMSGISDWIYQTYQKIVYGDATTYYSGSVASRNSTGFLSVPTYADNFMTGWFVNNYSYFSVFLIALCLIFTIIVGLLRKRKFSWYLVSFAVVVNMVLILPATGEIVPLMSNNFVQNMFTDKMSYWAISESVTNATMESDYVKNTTLSSTFLGSLTQDEQAQVISMVKNLNTVYLDRSLSIKTDISKKINQTATDTFNDVQELRSARWMLPMIMRQFSASDGSANYVYIPLSDKYEDISNLYWFYKPEDAAYVETVNAKKTYDGSVIPSYNGVLHMSNNRKDYFIDYVDLENGYLTDPDESDYKQISYTIGQNQLPHTYSYMIDSINLICGKRPDPNDYTTYDEWAKDYANTLYSTVNHTDFKDLETTMEQVADKYSRFDRRTLDQTFGYLWATENPLHFFYGGVKDSFESDASLGSLIGDLQGTYTLPDGATEEVRKSFMHDKETGNVKDVADLEDMFTNMIPYLYAMQLTAEGYKGSGGIFEPGEKMDLYTLYKDNDKSWLFRSNWVTKIMENKDYHASATIRLNDGTTVKIKNMLIPSCYEDAGRPMIFSEAQMKANGLSEEDLSLIELKCVKVNSEISKKWTLLLNYASLKGMTKEVMQRQMALDATLVFNQEFTPIGILNGAYAMYPSSIDLRSISFDSVMKMLMLNVTHDTSYIYGDTMQTIVEDSDIFTSIILLLTALVCSTIIPFLRNITMGLIFFLGLFSLIWAIFRSSKVKAKVSCGYFITNMAYLLLTFVYYLCFKAIMAMTTSDEVLTLSQIEVNTGNPIWCLIFVLVISIAYAIAMLWTMNFCLKNYRDMGFEVYAGIAEMAAGGISSRIESLGAKISGMSYEESSAVGVNGSGSSNGTPIGVSVEGQSDGEYRDGERSRSRTSDRAQSAYETSSYTDGRLQDRDLSSTDIDSEIERGRSMDTEGDSLSREGAGRPTTYSGGSSGGTQSSGERPRSSDGTSGHTFDRQGSQSQFQGRGPSGTMSPSRGAASPDRQAGVPGGQSSGSGSSRQPQLDRQSEATSGRPTRSPSSGSGSGSGSRGSGSSGSRGSSSDRQMRRDDRSSDDLNRRGK